MRALLTSQTFWTGVGAIAAVAALWYAKQYASLTTQIFRLELTPAIRMTRSVTHGDAGVIFKNVGRGSAIGIILTDSANRILQLQDSKGTFRDSIDALDPRISERLGRYKTVCQVPLPRVAHQTYFIYYQDLNGDWHATREHVEGNEFLSEFLGRQKVKSIPKQVKARAQVAQMGNA